MAERHLKKPIHLILDFDGTLTVKDTMSIFSCLPKEPSMTWDEISDAYMRDYNRHKAAPFNWSEYDRAEYSRWLASRKWVEERSAQRVQDSNFFRGVTLNDVNRAVDRGFENGDLQLRSGWADMLQLLCPSSSSKLPSSHRVSIISVNWSETMIRRSLWTAARSLEQPQNGILAKLANDMEIHANEIQGLGAPEGSSGRLCRLLEADVRTNQDKLRYFGALRNPEELTVYIGDSPTDFDCICAADLGIWLYDCKEGEYEEKFRATFSPLHDMPVPLSSALTTSRESEIFWSPNLSQVVDVVKKLLREE